MSREAAEAAIREAQGTMRTDEAGVAYATIAVAEATLALAEQQHIANLIHLVGFADVLADGVAAVSDDVLYARIKERMGLS